MRADYTGPRGRVRMVAIFIGDPTQGRAAHMAYSGLTKSRN
jgi:hypothetical protein